MAACCPLSSQEEETTRLEELRPAGAGAGQRDLDLDLGQLAVTYLWCFQTSEGCICTLSPPPWS